MRECHEHQSSQMAFGVDFTSVDMIDLVTQQAPWRSCATLKRTRHRAITSGALALLSEAFDGLLDDHSDRKCSSSDSSPYKWWPPDWPFSFPLDP
jgi:hypothetical protein